MYVIGNGNILTCDSSVPFISGGAAAVENGVIIKIGSQDMLRSEYPGAEFLDARGGIIMPGFAGASAVKRAAGAAKGLCVPPLRRTAIFTTA